MKNATQNETRGRWTARLFGNTGAWLNRKHGETDYFLIQFLSGHRGFQPYLDKIGMARSPDCVFCIGVVDDAHNTFFLWKVGWDSSTTLFKHS